MPNHVAGPGAILSQGSQIQGMRRGATHAHGEDTQRLSPKRRRRVARTSPKRRPIDEFPRDECVVFRSTRPISSMIACYATTCLGYGTESRLASYRVFLYTGGAHQKAPASHSSSSGAVFRDPASNVQRHRNTSQTVDVTPLAALTEQGSQAALFLSPNCGKQDARPSDVV